MPEGDAQHLTTLAEDGLDDAAEELLVAAKIGHLVSCHSDDGTLYLGRGIEDRRLDGEEILDMRPRLDEDGEDAILFIAGL